MISFSVITCTYNAAVELPRTLKSVAEQTYPHVEHLLIDGLSADATPALIQQYVAEMAQTESLHTIKVISERDAGLYDAMNKGIAMATGTYLVFINAGDVFPSPSTLETVACAVGEAETLPAVLYGDTDIVDAEGRFLRHRRPVPRQGLSWRSFSRGMLVCHQAFYALTSLAQQTPYNLHYRFSADVDWCIRVMKAGKAAGLPLKNVQAVVANYLDGGMTVKNHRASLKERFAVMRSHYGLPLTLVMHAWFVLRAVGHKLKSKH